MKLFFENQLIEGLIIKRTNRFLMTVMIDGEIATCHCPSTGRIGNIVFKDIPCLLSKNLNNKNRKTQYSVEAISLNNIDDEKKYWVGINQTKANKYIEYFLKTNQLKKIVNVGKNTVILREQKVDNSRLDFLVDNSYLEVKTPLVFLQLKKHYITNRSIEINNSNKFHSIDRLMKHLEELSISMKEHKKSYLLTFFMFDAEKFSPPDIDVKESKMVKNLVSKVCKDGVEMWQVNSIFEKDGISLKSYSPLDFLNR